MGASISFDSKYRLILDTEVECISVNPPGTVKEEKTHKKVKHDRANDKESESESGSGSESGSESETENKIYTVKITPEIINYIRSYLRKTDFLDEFDLITEIDLDNYDHAPGSALVFNSDSIVYITNNQTIEAVGEWEYLPSDKVETKHKSSKSKSKSKSNDEDTHDNARSKYKTKDDELPVSEIENILTTKFEEYNKGHEFVIHESKNNLLCLKINSVEILKA